MTTGIGIRPSVLEARQRWNAGRKEIRAMHDAGGLGTLARLGLPVTAVVVDNDGGGIFHFLPQADPASVASDRFEKIFGAPHGLDLTRIAEAYGVRATTVASITDLEAAIADPPAAVMPVTIWAASPARRKFPWCR